MTAIAPPDQNYTMGESAITLTVDEFKIGLCKVQNYEVSYSSRDGLKLQPKSIVFDEKKRTFTIQGAANTQDMIPKGESSIEVLVKVTGKAKADVSTSMEFIVTLNTQAAASSKPGADLTGKI